MIDRNMIGDRGEAMFYLAISKLHGDRPLFRPVHLGGKWPTADLTVELDGEPGMFFLVQVKTGTRGYTPDGKRLLLATDLAKLQLLADAPLPTYLVGVDEPLENVYFSALHGKVVGSASICMSYSAQDADVRVRLYNEVKEFWDGVRANRPWKASQFVDPQREEEPK